MACARSMDDSDIRWQHRQNYRLQSKECVASVKIGPVTWTIPVSLSKPAAPQGTLLPLNYTTGLTPSTTPPSTISSKELQAKLDCHRDAVLVRRLEDFSFQRAGHRGLIMSRTEDIVNTSLSVTLRGTGGDKDRDAASVWKEGLNCAARVLALSVSSQKRELLCDRKDPFAHLTPRRLAFTVIKSSLAVGAPMLNEVILDSLDEDDERRDPSWSSNEGRIGQGDRRFGGFLLGEDRGHANGRVFVDAQGNVVRMTQREAEQNDEEEKSDVMKAMAKSFENFPWLAFRRVLHNVMATSTQRILEWQAVVHLSKRTADRFTKNIALSALRKTKRMSREKAAAKMIVTAGRALCFQNLALFFVDEVFVTVRLVFQERDRRKNNPYACTDWEALLRELRERTSGNAMYVLCLWAAGTLGATVGTLVYPQRGTDLLSLLAEMGVSALLN